MMRNNFGARLGGRSIDGWLDEVDIEKNLLQLLDRREPPVTLADEAPRGCYTVRRLPAVESPQEERPTILDFKTDVVGSESDIADAIKGYRPQLRLYKRVLRRLTGLSDDAITCRLLFTRPRAIVDVDTD